MPPLGAQMRAAVFFDPLSQSAFALLDLANERAVKGASPAQVYLPGQEELRAKGY